MDLELNAHGFRNEMDLLNANDWIKKDKKMRLVFQVTNFPPKLGFKMNNETSI